MNTPRYSLAQLVGDNIRATEVRRLLNAARQFLDDLSEENYGRSATVLDHGLRGIADSQDALPEQLFRSLRVALCGQQAWPDLFEMMRSMGKDLVVERLATDLRALGDQAAG